MKIEHPKGLFNNNFSEWANLSDLEKIIIYNVTGGICTWSIRYWDCNNLDEFEISSTCGNHTNVENSAIFFRFQVTPCRPYCRDTYTTTKFPSAKNPGDKFPWKSSVSGIGDFWHYIAWNKHKLHFILAKDEELPRELFYMPTLSHSWFEFKKYFWNWKWKFDQPGVLLCLSSRIKIQATKDFLNSFQSK